MSAPAVKSAELEHNQLPPIGDTAKGGSTARPRGGTYPTWFALDAGGERPHLTVRDDGTEDLGAARVIQLYMKSMHPWPDRGLLGPVCRRRSRLRDMEGVVTDQYRDLVRDRRSYRLAKTRRSSLASDHLAHPCMTATEKRWASHAAEDIARDGPPAFVTGSRTRTVPFGAATDTRSARTLTAAGCVAAGELFVGEAQNSGCMLMCCSSYPD